jgi:adenylate cyclase
MGRRVVKRITYMSRFSRPHSRAQIDEIGVYSARRNATDGVTGVLVTLGSVFFQIIEGEEAAIDDLYARMLHDDRHVDVLCLQAEGTSERLFPEWSMKVIDLDDVTGDVVGPLKQLLARLGDAQHILERYTQPAVSRIMAQGLNPLDVPLRKVDRVVLFTDMVGFSAISHRVPVEAVAELVESYLEACSTGISAQGGEITKFLGDGVMAYFDVASADAAIQSCVDIERALERIRAGAPEGSVLRLLFSGYGLAVGSVIEGTVGSSIKADYTIIGEPVNTAARVEALTRTLGAPILMTNDVCMSAHGPWTFADAGEFDLGGDEPTSVRMLTGADAARRDMRSTVMRGLAMRAWPAPSS